MPGLFNVCPNCGGTAIRLLQDKQFDCTSCGFNYFINVATAVSAILTQGNKILLITRNQTPEKGKLDLPGGFVDRGESAEDALRREISEEIGVTATVLLYFGSYPNQYFYKDVLYHTCDLIFTAILEGDPLIKDVKELRRLEMQRYDLIEFNNIAFPSVRCALRDFIESIESSG